VPILVKGEPAGALKLRSAARLPPYLHLNIDGQLLGLDSLRQYACRDAVTACRQRGVGSCYTTSFSDGQARQGMLMAAEVWDRLAALEETSSAPSASQHLAAQHSN
jgi:hypothetical protein